MGTGRRYSAMGRTGRLRVVVVLVSVALSWGEEEASLDNQRAMPHLADEPAWFDISPLSDGDVDNLAREAEHYVKESAKLGALDQAERDVREKRLMEEAKRKQKLANRPMVDIPKEANEVAKLQQKLAKELLALDGCHKKLKNCKKELGEPGPIDIPKTTAQQDWDEAHKGTPASNWYRKNPIHIPKTTAEQDYIQAQKDNSHPADDEHEPGFKWPHDRLFPSDVQAIAHMANETKKLVDASLAESSKEKLETARSVSKSYVSTVQQLLKAETDLREMKRAPLKKESLAALASTAKLITECQANLQKAKC